MSETATPGGILFALLLAIAVSWIAKRKGFFELPPQTRYPLAFREVAGAYLTYALVSFLIFPVLVLLVAHYTLGVTKGASHLLPKMTLLWIQVVTFFLLFFALLFYLKKMKKESREEILWGSKREKSLKNIGLGGLTLLIAYPTVLFISQLTNYLTKLIFGESGVEQAAVKQLKALTHSPSLFVMLAIGIVFLVPFIEELLFRGFLQTYFKRYLGRGWAIVLTSALFSMAHFSKGQGVGNIELILSLFILACYLGFLYEKQRSLIAPYALHMFFNASTILAITWS